MICFDNHMFNFRGGEWGDHVTLQAAADSVCLEFEICIHTVIFSNLNDKRNDLYANFMFKLYSYWVKFPNY